jgi:hypothetical protein
LFSREKEGKEEKVKERKRERERKRKRGRRGNGRSVLTLTKSKLPYILHVITLYTPNTILYLVNFKENIGLLPDI